MIQETHHMKLKDAMFKVVQIIHKVACEEAESPAQEKSLIFHSGNLNFAKLDTLLYIFNMVGFNNMKTKL